jgi:hypothetical protein
MGSAEVQCELWGRAADDWASLQEAQHAPFFEAMLNAAGVGDRPNALAIDRWDLPSSHLSHNSPRSESDIRSIVHLHRDKSRLK